LQASARRQLQSETVNPYLTAAQQEAVAAIVQRVVKEQAADTGCTADVAGFRRATIYWNVEAATTLLQIRAVRGELPS
jgi:hypothetical protein